MIPVLIELLLLGTGVLIGMVIATAILLMPRTRAPAPTLAARRRQLPVREGEMEPSVDYKWINIAGERE